jgi:hypothetical protein
MTPACRPGTARRGCVPCTKYHWGSVTGKEDAAFVQHLPITGILYWFCPEPKLPEKQKYKLSPHIGAADVFFY